MEYRSRVLWKVGPGSGYGSLNGVQIKDSRDFVVAVAIGDVPELDAKTNARMIAAVPELVAALEFYANPETYKPHPHGPAFDDRDVSYVARAALAKAREGSPS